MLSVVYVSLIALLFYFFFNLKTMFLDDLLNTSHKKNPLAKEHKHLSANSLLSHC